jgi:hypothetical protein
MRRGAARPNLRCWSHRHELLVALPTMSGMRAYSAVRANRQRRPSGERRLTELISIARSLTLWKIGVFSFQLTAQILQRKSYSAVTVWMIERRLAQIFMGSLLGFTATAITVLAIGSLLFAQAVTRYGIAGAADQLTHQVLLGAAAHALVLGIVLLTVSTQVFLDCSTKQISGENRTLSALGLQPSAVTFIPWCVAAVLASIAYLVLFQFFALMVGLLMSLVHGSLMAGGGQLLLSALSKWHPSDAIHLITQLCAEVFFATAIPMAFAHLLRHGGNLQAISLARALGSLRLMNTFVLLTASFGFVTWLLF